MYNKEVISGGETQYHYQDETGKNIMGKKLSLAELKGIPAGYGGRIGVIPWCIVDNVKYHILCDIHWQKRGKEGNVMGDLGGGIKKHQTPYDALYNELQDEVPGWFDILKSQLEHSPIDIHSIEYLHAPLHNVRYSITIFVNITPYIKVLNELFSASKEIYGLHAFNDFDDMLLLNTNMNYGLMYFKDYVVYQHLYNEREKQKREEEQRQKQEAAKELAKQIARELALQHQIAIQKHIAAQQLAIQKHVAAQQLAAQQFAIQKQMAIQQYHIQQHIIVQHHIAVQQQQIKQQQQMWAQHQMWMQHQMQMRTWMQSQNINTV